MRPICTIQNFSAGINHLECAVDSIITVCNICLIDLNGNSRNF